MSKEIQMLVPFAMQAVYCRKCKIWFSVFAHMGQSKENVYECDENEGGYDTYPQSEGDIYCYMCGENTNKKKENKK